jgi:hypothetical protein
MYTYDLSEHMLELELSPLATGSQAVRMNILANFWSRVRSLKYWRKKLIRKSVYTVGDS